MTATAASTRKPKASGEMVVSRLVAARVRSLRQQRGWTVDQLAAALTETGHPINRAVITNIETGRPDKTGRCRRSVTVDELCAFALVYGIGPEKLLAGPACPVCKDAPPPGFACLNCGANTDRTTA